MANPTLKPLPAARFDYWRAHHLLNRAGFGGTPGQVRALANMGLDDAVDYIVDYATIDVPPVRADAFDAGIMRPLSEQDRRRQREAQRDGDEDTLSAFRAERQQRQRADRRQMAAFQEWWLERLIESPRPLEEKMTLFWHGHFATGYRAIEDSYHMFRQNQTFRVNAVGNFGALVHAIIHDPAMLRYLNNDQNRRQRPNENLARELLELFMMGEGNGYTEQDIREGARALTGYTFEDDAFVFRPRLHDGGEKRILGHAGTWDGDDFVDIILANDYTAEFITLKLYRFFVNDLPDGPDRDRRLFLQKLSQRFRTGKYELRPVLKTLFRSEHFYDDANVAAQIKSPVQLIVQAIRGLHTPVRSVRALIEAADLMGQNIGYPPSVKGWDGGRAWINTSTLFVRQNVLVYLLTGRRPHAYAWQTDGASYDATHLVEHLHTAGSPDPRDVVLYLLRFNLGVDPRPQRVETLLRFVEDAGGRIDNAVLIGLLSLIGAMPEYQLC